MKRVNIVFSDHSTASFEKVINHDEILNSLNENHRFFEVIDDYEGTLICKIDEVISIFIK